MRESGLPSTMALAPLAGLALFVVFGRPAYGTGELPESFAQTPDRGPGESYSDGVRSRREAIRAEKGGTLRVIEGGEFLPEPFVDISGRPPRRASAVFSA